MKEITIKITGHQVNDEAEKTPWSLSPKPKMYKKRGSHVSDI